MGNNLHSTQVNRDDFITADQFNSIAKKKENNFYESRVSTSHRSREYLRKTINFSQCSENVTNYITRLDLIGRTTESENLYIPVICNIRGEEAMCSDNRILELYYQNYDVKFTDEIAARRRRKDRFQEQQVWYVLFSLVNACQKFQKYTMPSGNLKTQHIVLNEKGHIKVINCLSCPQESQSQYDLPTFYAPQQLTVFREHSNRKPNPNVCQTFSIAIILLEMCSFINGERFYDMDTMKINQNTMRRAEEIVWNGYSKLFNNLLKTMTTNHNDRPLPSQIYSAFKAYKKEILSLKPFKFDTMELKGQLSKSTGYF